MGAVQNHKAVLHVKNRFSISNMSGDRGKWSRAKGNIWLYTSSVRVAKTTSVVESCYSAEQNACGDSIFHT